MDRKILADLAVNEPLSFKAVSDEIARQNNFNFSSLRSSKRFKETRGPDLEAAFKSGSLRQGKAPSKEEIAQMEAAMIPKDFVPYKLRYPERDAKTDADYMRISFVEEDQEFLAE